MIKSATVENPWDILLQLNRLEKRAAASLALIFALRMLGLFMVLPVFAIYGDLYGQATPLLIGMAPGMSASV